MKTIMGFNDVKQEQESRELIEKQVKENAKLSLARVRINGFELTYLNEDFELNVGDMVFVNGTKYGIPGVVTEIMTKFKADKSKLKKIIAHPDISVKGTYENSLNFMVSTSEENVSPEQFRSWVIPPKDPDNANEEEIILGEGYEVSLDTFETGLSLSPQIFDRALDYITNGNFLYLSMCNGVGTAFLLGSEVYEVNFKYADGRVYDLYCGCPYAGFCKHATATLLVFRKLMNTCNLDDKNFVAINSDYFWEHLSHYSKQVVLS